VGSLAFVLGFSLVFVSFGALFGGLGSSLKTHERLLQEIFGVVTIALGLFFAGWWPSTWLQRERRVHHLPRVSVLGAGALGFTFALGWTACIGPTLAAILGLAASSSGATALRGSILAFFYCLGLGVPFVVAALATEWMATASTWFRRHAKVIGIIGGGCSSSLACVKSRAGGTPSCSGSRLLSRIQRSALKNESRRLTRMNVRDDWSFRGLIHLTTDEEVFDRLSAGTVTVYAVLTRRRSSLHLGHLFPLCNLRRLQLAGNAPIALAGGGTGLIGDPSFKDVSARC